MSRMEWFRCFSNEALAHGGASPPLVERSASASVGRGRSPSPVPPPGSPGGGGGGGGVAASPTPAGAASPAEARASAERTLGELQKTVPVLLANLRREAALKDEMIGELRAQLERASESPQRRAGEGTPPPPRPAGRVPPGVNWGDFDCEEEREKYPSPWKPEYQASTDDDDDDEDAPDAGETTTDDADLDAFIDGVPPPASDDSDLDDFLAKAVPAGSPGAEDAATDTTDDLEAFVSEKVVDAGPDAGGAARGGGDNAFPPATLAYASPTASVSSSPRVQRSSISPVRVTKPAFDLPNFETFEMK